MNRESLDKFCERGILGLVLAILVFTPLAFGGRSQFPIGSSLDFILVDPFGIVQAISLAVLALWGIRLWADPRPRLLWPPVCWAVVAFALYAVIRYLTADVEYLARAEMLQVLVYGFLFLAIVNNLHRQESAQTISLTLIFLAMAISFYAIYQFATSSDRVWDLVKPYAHRGTGTFISPNNLGGFLEMILPLGLAYTLTSRMKLLPKVFIGYASLVILGGIVVTVSRGSWAATALALVVLYLVVISQRSYRLPAVALLIVAIVVGALFAPRDAYLQERIKQLTNSKGTIDDDDRFGIWNAALQLWHENITWGIGPNHFDARFGKFRPEIVQTSPERVHNDYLNTLTDWGVVGTALVVAAFVLLFIGAFWTWRSVRRADNTLGEQRSTKLALVLGTSIGLLAILAHSFVDFNLHIPANAIVAVTLMALLTCYLRFATERYWFSARLASKILLTLALAAGFAYLSVQTVRSARQSVWLIRAHGAKIASDEQIDALKKAFSFDSNDAGVARAIGEAFRQQSWQNTDDYKDEALEAMQWFKLAIGLNRWDDSSVLRYGMCLDQIDRHDEAMSYFDRAVKMDPNSYFNNAYMGWHYAQAGDYAAAIPWLERSHRLEWKDNPVADNYLKIARDQLLLAATNTTALHLGPAQPQTVLPPWDGK